MGSIVSLIPSLQKGALLEWVTISLIITQSSREITKGTSQATSFLIVMEYCCTIIPSIHKAALIILEDLEIRSTDNRQLITLMQIAF